MTTPATDIELYFGIRCAGRMSPGTVKISGHTDTLDIRKSTVQGNTHQRHVFAGSVPSAWQATFYLANPAQVDAWEEFQTHLESYRKPKPKHFEVVHPDLARVGITRTTCLEIGGFVHDGLNGAYVTVKFLEYRPTATRDVLLASGGKDKPGGSNTGPGGDDPNAERKRRLEAANASFNAAVQGF